MSEMGAPGPISVATLRAQANALFDVIEKKYGLAAIEMDTDFYWSIEPPDLYEMEGSPAVTVGSLADDREFLRNVLSGDDTAIASQFRQLAPILFYVGHKVGTDFAHLGG